MIVGAVCLLAGAVYGAVLVALCIAAGIADDKVRLTSSSLYDRAKRVGWKMIRP
jgi:hypothetical protein